MAVRHLRKNCQGIFYKGRIHKTWLFEYGIKGKWEYIQGLS